MRGVWGGTHGRIHVESSNDSTWKISGTTAAVDPPSGRGAQDIHNIIPSKGGTEAVSGNRVPGGFRDKDGDAGELHALARTRHHGDWAARDWVAAIGVERPICVLPRLCLC